MRFLAILAAVLACSEAQEASAATLKSVYYFNSDDEILAQPDPDGDSISLYTEVPQFDPSLGTLTGVALQLDAYSGPTASIYVVLSGGASTAGGVQTDLEITGPGFSALNDSDSLNIPCISDELTCIGDDTLIVEIHDIIYMAPQDWAAYVGTGTVGFGATALADPYGAATLFQFTAQLIVTVFYEYSEETSSPGVVPLPAAAWLLLAGLGGLALTRRR